jgi:hypothetical protein
MGKTWVLNTETKGTGASVVPLEPVRQEPRNTPGRPWVPPRGRPRQAPEPQRPPARTFKVIDVLTRETLGQGDIRQTVDLLAGVRSAVDANVYVWEPRRDAWRLLSLREKHALWSFRESSRARES